MQEQYVVDGNLNHDGTYLKTGDTLLLTPEQAAPLLEIGRVKKAEPAAPAQPSAQPDGFPLHNTAPQAPQAPPAPSEPAAPATPAAPQTVTPPAAPATNPTPEQIAQDVAQL